MNYIPNVARKGAAGTLLPVRNGVGRLRTVLAAALLLLVILPASAQRIVVNVTAKKQTLADILPQISKQTGIEFSYALELVKTRSNAAGRLEGDVKDVLGRILAGTGIDYRMQGSNRIFLSRKAGPGPESPAAPGKYRLTGTVRDGQGQPLVGVTVIVGGTDGTATGSDGSYSLMVAPDATLTFRYIGYGSVTEAVNNRSQIDVVMKDQSTELEELVVVGYRTVKKLSLTGSVASVDIKRKENQPITNSTQMLYNTPGIWVNQGGSQPGRDNATISIRGVNSLNSTGGAPLVLLDGVEYDFSEIDPSTIESISVLKDVSAAIYGLKAANGVILVTSKKGSKGRPRIEYKGKYGVQRATYLPDVVTDPILYMRLRNLAEINSGISPGAVSYSNGQILEYMEGMKTDRSVYPGVGLVRHLPRRRLRATAQRAPFGRHRRRDLFDGLRLHRSEGCLHRQRRRPALCFRPEAQRAGVRRAQRQRNVPGQPADLRRGGVFDGDRAEYHHARSADFLGLPPQRPLRFDVALHPGTQQHRESAHGGRAGLRLPELPGAARHDQCRPAAGPASEILCDGRIP